VGKHLWHEQSKHSMTPSLALLASSTSWTSGECGGLWLWSCLWRFAKLDILPLDWLFFERFLFNWPHELAVRCDGRLVDFIVEFVIDDDVIYRLELDINRNHSTIPPFTRLQGLGEARQGR